MIRKLVMLSLGFFIVLTPAASAGDYETPTLTAESLGNGEFRISGTGCAPGELVSIQFNPTVETTADANGRFSAVIDVSGLSGDVTVTATCGDLVQSLVLTLGAGEPLPRTGDDSSLPLARLGAIMAAMGGAALYASKKRSRDARATISV